MWNVYPVCFQIYVSRYKFKNAEMSQLWQTFAEVSKRKWWYLANPLNRHDASNQHLKSLKNDLHVIPYTWGF